MDKLKLKDYTYDNTVTLLNKIYDRGIRPTYIVFLYERNTIVESYYISNFDIIELSKFYSRVGYYTAKCRIDPKYDISILLYLGSTDDNLPKYRTVTEELIKLAEENDRYEVCKGYKDLNSAKSYYY